MRNYSVYFCIDVFRPQNSIYFFVGKIFVVLFIKCQISSSSRTKFYICILLKVL